MKSTCFGVAVLLLTSAWQMRWKLTISCTVEKYKYSASSMATESRQSTGKVKNSQALFTQYRITYVSDPFLYRIGVFFIRLCMNLIALLQHSVPTIRYNSAPHQQVVRKSIRYNSDHFVSRVNVIIRYGTLPNLALVWDGLNANEIDRLLGK